MFSRQEKKMRMMELAKGSEIIADNLLCPEIEKLKSITKINWDKINPSITDRESYERLITAINQSNLCNEGIEELKNRINGLGVDVISTARIVLSLLTNI